MGWSTCKYCGDKIVWAQMPAGNYLPMDPEMGGLHECVPFERGESPPPTRGWSVTDRDLPVTYPTKCWWCGERVFFHTNGFGDCVLFDELGWPWQVHACWEEHVAERSNALSAIDADLEAVGFNGRFYRPRQEPVPPGRDGSEVTVEGYVADNHALYDEPHEVGLSAAEQGGASGFVSVDVADASGRLFRFFVPREAAKQLVYYALVRMRGVWRIHRGVPHLIATSYRQQRYSPESAGDSVNWQLRGPLGACYYCWRRLSKSTAWGFDPGFHPECGKCSAARGALTSREFLALCRRIAAHRARK